MTATQRNWSAGEPAELLASLPSLVRSFLRAETSGDAEDIVRASSALLKATQGSTSHVRKQREIASGSLHDAGWTLPEIANVAKTTPQRVYAIIRGIRGGKPRDDAAPVAPKPAGRPRKSAGGAESIARVSIH